MCPIGFGGANAHSPRAMVEKDIENKEGMPERSDDTLV